MLLSFVLGVPAPVRKVQEEKQGNATKYCNANELLKNLPEKQAESMQKGGCTVQEVSIQMTDKQIMNAMELLASLYADQMGIENPVITIKTKEVQDATQDIQSQEGRKEEIGDVQEHCHIHPGSSIDCGKSAMVCGMRAGGKDRDIYRDLHTPYYFLPFLPGNSRKMAEIQGEGEEN